MSLEQVASSRGSPCPARRVNLLAAPAETGRRDGDPSIPQTEEDGGPPIATDSSLGG